jgi:hypothetical protein
LAIILSNTIVMPPVAALIPYARNARTHSDAQVAQIAASIREFGFTDPLMIDELLKLESAESRPSHSAMPKQDGALSVLEAR